MNAIPKRGVVATALTAVALALILSFKTPNMSSLAAGNGNSSNGSGASSQQSPGSGRSTFSGQLTGSTVQTPFGAVQVQVTLQNGRITDVQALQMPGDQRRSQQISQYAVPQLRSEVLQAQGAQVDTISGATYTSEGYAQSLQSALDQAGA